MKYIFMILTLSLFLQAFTISKENIIVQKYSSPIFAISAKELSFYIEKVVSSKIIVKRDLKGIKSPIILLKLTKSKLKPGGFIIKSYKNKLVIASNSDAGILNGTYFFLDKYIGCKFLTKDFEYIPHYKQKKLPNFTDLQQPAFAYREIFISEADNTKFALKNLLNGRLGHRIELDKNSQLHKLFIDTHSFISSEILDEKYQCNGQYDYKKFDVKKQAVSNIKKSLSKLSKDKTFAILEHEDRGSTCKDTPQVDFLSYTSYIANSLQKDFPNVTFFHQAYFWSKKAPQNISKLPPNLGVHFAPIEADFSKPLHHTKNKELWNDLLSWKNKTNNVIVWHYITNFNSYLTPYPDLYPISQDLKDFKKLGFISGVFLQGSYGGDGGDLSHLKIWVLSKLLWNPNQNIDKLIEKFCRYYYGYGAKDVVKYIKTLELFIQNSKEKLDLKAPITMKYLNLQNLNKLDKILSNALKKVPKNSIYYEHIKELFLGIDLVRTLRGDDFSQKQKVKKRLINYLENHPKIESFSESIPTKQILKLLKLDRQKATIPQKAQGLKKGIDWLDFQEYQLELCCTKLVTDKDASDKIAATMDGNSEEWGFSLNILNIPKAKWDIFARVKISLNSHNILDKAKWALKYGIEPNINKGIKLIGQMKDNRYITIKLGTIDLTKQHPKYLWISPPGNNVVKNLYLDRIFFIKKY